MAKPLVYSLVSIFFTILNNVHYLVEFCGLRFKSMGGADPGLQLECIKIRSEFIC